jgi:hypothetical protein
LDWRTFWQRLILLVLVGGMVLGLIKADVDPYLALTIVGGIVLILKDLWLPNRDEDEKEGPGGAVPPQRPRPTPAVPPIPTRPPTLDEQSDEGASQPELNDEVA